MGKDLRIVRVALSIDLVRRLDELLVQSVSGYQTRTEFIRDAVEAMILELTYDPAPDEPAQAAPVSLPGLSGAGASRLERPAKGQSEPRAPDRALGLGITIIHALERGATVAQGVAEVSDEPLFGLHNRDYASLWAAAFLARLSGDGPVPVEEFLAKATAEAWTYGETLTALEEENGLRLTSLFPTNRQKPQSAEAGFRAFAVGGYSLDDGRVEAWGPLFAWRLCQLCRGEANLLIGMTPEGYDLLAAVDGLSLELPHSPEHAQRFLDHLRRFAAGDWWGFRKVLVESESGITRTGLVESFHADRTDWTQTVAATNAAGYVARAREWGLLEEKQVEGQYRLTEFGREQLLAERGRN